MCVLSKERETERGRERQRGERERESVCVCVLNKESKKCEREEVLASLKIRAPKSHPNLQMH